MYALKICNLSKTYVMKSRQIVQALESLNLNIEVGEVFGFLGPNGAGKSTTIKTIMGQLRPSGGNALIFDKPSNESNSRMKVGYLPENPAFYDFLTGREYLHFVGKTFGMEDRQIWSSGQTLLELLDLSAAADRQIRNYSKGMVQRLGLAQAMIHDPDIYILDEPMSGLDPVGRSLVKDVIKQLKQRGKTVFFSTHITSDIEVVCDRVGILAKGRLLAVDRVDSILKKGIVGYLVHVSRNGRIEEIEVEKSQLKDFLVSVIAQDLTVEQIMPRRKDMEAFFLEIISQEHVAEQ